MPPRRRQQPSRLIVTADDFGLSVPINEAVEVAHRTGVLSAASLMVGEDAAEDAIRRAKAAPSLRVGLHLALVDARPVLPPAEIPRLCGRDGRLRADMTRLAFAIAFDPRASAQLDLEIDAQFQAYARTGLPLDHVDSHKHFQLHPLIAAKILRIGKSYGLRALRVPHEPARLLRAAGGPAPHPGSLGLVPWTRLLRAYVAKAGVFAPDFAFGMAWTGALAADRLARLIATLPDDGAIEIFAHPATSDAFPGSAPGFGYRQELAALTDPAVREAVQRSNRQLGGMSDALG